MAGDLLAAMASLLSWWNNPFLLRGFRAEWRRRNPESVFAGLSVLLAAPVGLVILAGAFVGPHSFSAHWGGSWGGLAFTLHAALHVPLVYRAAAAGRRREWIPLEAKLGTLDLILTSPMTRDEIITKKALYPCCQAMALALLGLPFYVTCWAIGDMPFSQIGCLYLLLAIFSFSPTLRIPHSVLASSRRQQIILMGFLLAGAFRWMALAAPHISGGWGYFASLPVTYANVLTDWLARPAGFYAFTVAPWVLLLFAHAMWWGVNVRVAAAQLETSPETMHRAVTRRRFWLIWILVLMGLGLIWPGLIETGDLAREIGIPTADRGTVVLLVLGAIVLLIAGTELLERGATRLSPLTAYRWLIRADGPLALRVAAGSAHAAAVALVLPGLLLVACLCGTGGGPPVALDLVVRVFVTLALGLVMCYGMGLLLWSQLRGRPRAYSASSILLTLILMACPLLGPATGVREVGYIAAASPATLYLALCPEWVQAIGAEGTLPEWPIAAMVLGGGCLMTTIAAGLSLRGGLSAIPRRPAMPADVAEVPSADRGGVPERWSALVLQLFQKRWDNPLAVLGLRQASRSGALLGTPMLALGLSVAIAVYAIVRQPSLKGMPLPCHEWTGPWTVMHGLEAAAAYIPLLIGLFMALISATTAGVAWGDDARKRTLGFVLSTPLSREDIAIGRFYGVALPQLMGLAVSMPIALVCGLLSLSPAALPLVILGYAWALTFVLIAGRLGLWLGMARRSGVDAAGLPLAYLVLLGLSRWWYLGATQGIVDARFSGPWGFGVSCALYLPFLLLELAVSHYARKGAILSVEARRLVEPFADNA